MKGSLPWVSILNCILLYRQKTPIYMGVIFWVITHVGGVRITPFRPHSTIFWWQTEHAHAQSCVCIKRAQIEICLYLLFCFKHICWVMLSWKAINKCLSLAIITPPSFFFFWICKFLPSSILKGHCHLELIHTSWSLGMGLRGFSFVVPFPLRKLSVELEQASNRLSVDWHLFWFSSKKQVCWGKRWESHHRTNEKHLRPEPSISLAELGYFSFQCLSPFWFQWSRMIAVISLTQFGS